MACVSFETGCKADVNQASGESVTTCLECRLSLVRAPSPASRTQEANSGAPSQVASDDDF
jgi:hypothetical protein